MTALEPSSKGALFMFLHHGGQPHSIIRRSREKLTMRHLLRAVDTGAVVVQALEVLASEIARQALALPAGGDTEPLFQETQDEPANV